MKIALIFVFSLAASQVILAQVETTKTSVANIESESAKSPFGISLFSLGGIDRQQLTNATEQGQSVYFFENYLSFAYRVSKDFRLSARYSFNYSTAGINNSGKEVTDKADTRDMSLLLTFNNVLDEVLPESMSYKIQPRLYLPTSEKSKAQGLITSLRLENEVKINTERYSYFRIWLNPQYFFQRTTVFLDDRLKTQTTDMFAVKHGVEYSQSLNKTFALKPGFEIEDTWSNASEVNNKAEFRKSSIDYRFGLEYKVSKPLSFTLGYGHKKDFIKTEEFTDGFTLMTNLTLL